MKQVFKTGFVLLAKGIVNLLLGLHVHDQHHLPPQGPAILVANHNSHLDALVLMSLYPLKQAKHLRPIANAHYFLEQNPCLAWFARHVLNIIPVTVSSQAWIASPQAHRHFLKHCAQALANQEILILFPEGSRGQPEHLSHFHNGIAHLAKQHPTVPVIPIWLTNLGKALPKGDPLFVPFVCGAFIGTPMFWNGHKQAFLQGLTDSLHALSAEA